jgi:hypothetical protein
VQAHWLALVQVSGCSARDGFCCATAIRTGLRRELYGVPPLDPVAVGVTVGILAMVGLIACAWPARCAIRADPARALRD